MIINAKNKILIVKDKQYNLTDLQYKLLIAISSGEIIKIKKIAKYMFNSGSNEYIKRVKIVKKQLIREVADIKILSYIDSYRLKTEILFT